MRGTAIRAKFLLDVRGAAAVEFALASIFLIYGMMNAVDVAFFIYERMEVAKASQIAVQAAWTTCNNVSADLPATQNCSGLNSAVQSAIHSTGLGSAISLAGGSPSEGYYCVNASGALQQVGTPGNKPADCSAVGSPATSPGDYIFIATTTGYSSFFQVSVMGAMGLTSITQSSWMRLG